MSGRIPGVTTDKIYRRDLLDPVMRWLGTWNGTIIYLPGDVISSGGHSYVCILQNSNTQPPNTTYWTQL